MSTALIHQEHACNSGHLHFQSFAEYTRHLISAAEHYVIKSVTTVNKHNYV